MHARLLLSIVGLLLLPTDAASSTAPPTVAGGATDPVITAASEYASVNEKRAGYNDFIGYWSDRGTWFTETCSPSSHYATYSGYGGCCPDGQSICNYATACAGSNVLYMNGESFYCEPGSLCDTLTVSFATEVTSGAHSLLRCFPTSAWHGAPRVLYRTTYELMQSVTVTETRASMTVTQVVTVTANAAPNTESPKQAAGVAGFCMSLVIMMLYGV